jgi:hypothetical protein
VQPSIQIVHSLNHRPIWQSAYFQYRDSVNTKSPNICLTCVWADQSATTAYTATRPAGSDKRYPRDKIMSLYFHIVYYSGNVIFCKNGANSHSTLSRCDSVVFHLLYESRFILFSKQIRY